MSFKKLTKLIDASEFEKYIVAAEDLETIFHTYGNPQPVMSYTCWMEYKTKVGSISFTRNTANHPILKEMVEKVLTLLTPIFPADSPPHPLRLHIIKTVNSINPHTDEGGRLCCINIGLKDSSNAVVQVSNDNCRETFLTNHTDYIVEEGYAYLLNTANLHSVVGIDQPRYLITYAFGNLYDEVLRGLRLQ